MNERDLFAAALQHENPLERTAFLDRACAGDAALRRRLDLLLTTHDNAGSFLEKSPVVESGTDADQPSSPVEVVTGPSTVQETGKPKADSTADPDPYLTQVPPSNEETAPTPPPSAPSRYRTLRPLKRGGLGEVFVALDEELQREVALKRIQEKHADNPDFRGRFVLEAEVTGRLEHPGVVPVYGLGLSPDGRPYYAMRFIKGESFSDAITRFHAADKAGRDPGERSLAFRELLRRFTDLCNAIAYAHSKGVLHRDLKPDNVMLGAFGETLVIDWGLAKVLGETADDSAKGSIFTSAATDKLDKTDIAGTPPYMSPEQAIGAVETLGAATDVYSLGAILYVLITGQQAFKGSSARVLELVSRGQFEPPRRVNVSAPRALEAVCLKAMARLPEKRYASARELAADVNRWLADEPTTAWREPWMDRTRRWTRRHRTLMASAGVLLLSTTVGLAVGLWLVNAEKNRTKQAEEQTKTALVQVTEEQGKTKAALTKVTEEQDKNEAVYVKYIFERFKNSELLLLSNERRLELQTYFRDLQISRVLGDDDKGKDWGDQLDLSISLEKLGDVQLQLGDKQAALDSYRRSLDIRQKLADHFKDDLQAQRDLLVSLNNLGDVQLQLGDKKVALDSYRRDLAIAQKLADDHKDDPQAQRDLLVSFYKLGNVAENSYSYQEAADWYKKGLEVPKRHPHPGFFEQEAAILTNRLAFCETAAKAVADLDFALKQPEALVPGLLNVRIHAWHQQGKHAEVVATADKFHTLATLPGKPAGGNIYDAACGYALASTCVDADDKTKEAHAAKAVALLQEARDKGYFKTKERVEHAKKDADLDPLRQRDDFKALLAELEKDAK